MLIYGWNQISMGGWNDISLSSWWMLWQLSPPSSTPRRLQPDGGQRPVKALQGSAGGTLRSRWVMDSYKSVPRGSDEEARRNDMCSLRLVAHLHQSWSGVKGGGCIHVMPPEGTMNKPETHCVHGGSQWEVRSGGISDKLCHAMIQRHGELRGVNCTLWERSDRLR